MSSEKLKRILILNYEFPPLGRGANSSRLNLFTAVLLGAFLCTIPALGFVAHAYDGAVVEQQMNISSIDASTTAGANLVSETKHETDARADGDDMDRDISAYSNAKTIIASSALTVWKDIADIVASLLTAFTAVAVLIGLFVYRKLFRRIEFVVDVSFVAVQHDQWVVEAIAHIRNRGLVSHSITKFEGTIRYLLPGDKIEKKHGFCVHFPHKTETFSWIPTGWSRTWVEPGVSTRYSLPVSIPRAATAVLIHGKFYYRLPAARSDDWHTADKLVAVPSMVEPLYCGAETNAYSHPQLRKASKRENE